MAIDLKLGNHIIRMISIYMPHAGYDQSHGFGYFESIIDQLHGLLHEAKRLHYRIVIGGDFNLVVANNRRADLLLDLVHAFDLVIGDDPQLHIDDSSWTHSHPIYGRRQIDFILFPRNFIVDECHASEILDLGSDHRAVRAQLHLPKRRNK